MNTTWYLQSHVVCFNVSYVCIVCPFVNFERFTKVRLRNDSRSCQTSGVSPAEPEDFPWIKNYSTQLKLYAQALARIFQCPVTEAWLHFLAPQKSVRVEL